MQTVRVLLLCLLPFWLATQVAAFPEFQFYARKHSGVPVDCAMCHVNPAGPIGTDFGQIGRLDDQELARLNQARQAVNPGQIVDNPILNAFGDRIVQTLGMRQVLQLRGNPAGLAPALGDVSDLDGDGIPDSHEYLAGTNPLDPESGQPALLLGHKLANHWGSLLFAALALGWLIYGLLFLRKGLAHPTPGPSPKRRGE